MAEIYLPGWVGGWVGGTDSDNRASPSSNWTELDWTGTELGNKQIFGTRLRFEIQGIGFRVRHID